MIVPYGAEKFSEALRWGAEVFHTLKGVLKKRGYSTSVGDEGGFAPNLKSNDEALEVVLEAITQAGYKPGEQIGIALDPAASEFYDAARRSTSSRNPTRASAPREQMVEFWADWVRQYPIVSIEDGMAEDDWDGWKTAHRQARQEDSVGRRRSVRHQHGASRAEASSSGIANSILIKVNQIGTLTETLEAIKMASDAGYTSVISHRSRRNRRRLHRRPRGRHRRRPDQDRLGQPHRPHREIQPASAHRRGSRLRRALSRAARRSGNDGTGRHERTAADSDHSRRLGLLAAPSKATPSPPRANRTTTACCAIIPIRWSIPPGPSWACPKGRWATAKSAI